MKTHTTAIFICPQWKQWTQNFSVYLNACNILIHLSLYAYNPGSNTINMSQSADNNKVYIDQQPKAVLSQNPIFNIFRNGHSVCHSHTNFQQKWYAANVMHEKEARKRKEIFLTSKSVLWMKIFGQRRNELQHFCFAWTALVWANSTLLSIKRIISVVVNEVLKGLQHVCQT